MKKYNFNAGPSILPREVIENTAKQILDFNGSGLSLMEISHRAKDFQPVVDECVALFKELLDIPEGYSVIFLGGGASLQFMQIPANFLIKKAAFINSGTWAKDGVNISVAPTCLMQAARLLESQNKNDEALSIYKEIKTKYVKSYYYSEIDKYIERLTK